MLVLHYQQHVETHRLRLRTEKVAGSSPAERAPKDPANGHVALPRPEAFWSSRFGPPGVGTDSPFLKKTGFVLLVFRST
jgi:hypothetical protein